MKPLYKLIIHIVTCICLFVISNLTFSQSPLFYNLNNENKLPTNEVYNIIQSKNGHVWIGCNSGIYRYDGINFKYFENSKQNGRALSFLKEDKKGRIWAKNFFGQIFKVQNEQLQLVLDLKSSEPNYPQFTFDNKSNLIIYKGNDILKYNDGGIKIKSIKVNQIEKNEAIISLLHYDNFIYILTDKKKVIRLSDNFKSPTLIEKGTKTKTVNARSHFFIHKNKIHLFCEEYIDQRFYSITSINTKSAKFEKAKTIEISNDEILHGVYSDGEQIWTFGSKGAFTVDKPNKRYFSEHKISHILKDNEDVLWFSSLNKGLFVVPNLDFISLNPNTENSENHFTCASIIEKNKALLGTYAGKLYLYNIKDKTLKLVHESSNQSFFAVKQIKNYKNYIIVSRGRLCIIDKITGKQHFAKYSNIRDFCIKGNDVYIVLPQFVAKIKFEDLLKEKPKLTIIHNEGGKEIEYDSKNNRIIVSLSKGTFWVDDNNSWTEIKDNNQSIYASSLSYHSGVIWIGTISNGVFGYNKDKQIAHFYDKNKIQENAILNLHATEKNLWINTEKYLYRLRLTDKKIDKIGRNHCINSTNIINLHVSNNQVFLATNKEVIYFPENLNLKNRKKASITLNKITENGKKISLSKKIKLESNHSNLKFYFSTLLLKNRGDYSIKYRLNGLSKNWETVSSNDEFISFPQLPSGNFQFEIKVIDPYGSVSNVESIELVVLKPFWNTIWFFILCALIFIIICVYIAILRIKFIKRKSEAKNKLIQSQLTALKAQMNPHFMFNTLNSLQDLMLKQDFKNTNYYLSKYASLLRMILTNSEKNEISIEEEISMLDAYLKLEKLRFGEDFSYVIESSDELINENNKIPPMIIQPFVENAIKHGLLHHSGEKKLEIKFEQNENNIICTIEDNGIGRKMSAIINQRQGKSYQSFSTNATDKRIQLMTEFHKKDYSVQIIDLEMDNVALGTKVIISFAKK